ncbi:MAG: response regulator [Candidatus Wildermuthbacteria bacterium]|nr:response regulator [Candidatus Wildermuthbacteria bacterium]
MKKILLVEDDPLLIDIYTTKLQQSGFEVQVVEQGEKVLAAIQKEKPAVVLLDIVLPHVDGWDILQQVQASEELKHIPIIILSNLGQKEEIEKGLRLGAVRYLIKAHYTPSQIVEEVVKLTGSL